MIKTFAALMLALTAATPTLATPTEVRVSYADLDIASAEGRRVLDRRLASAIGRVCGSYAEVKAEDADRITACRKAARASIAPQLADLATPDRVVAVAAPMR